MDEWFRDFYEKNFNPEIPIRIKFLQLCAISGTLCTFLGTLASLISGVNSSKGLALCLFQTLFFFVLFILTQLTEKYNLCIYLGIIGLNFITYPMLYFTMGGVRGGMPLYFMTGILFSLLTLSFGKAIIFFILEILNYAAVFLLGEKYPYMFEDIPLLEDRYILDTALDFLVVSLTTLFLVRCFFLAYDKQQAETKRLILKLSKEKEQKHGKSYEKQKTHGESDEKEQKCSKSYEKQKTHGESDEKQEKHGEGDKKEQKR